MNRVATEFITAFQFLTRIHIVTQTQWSEESFGRIVKFFPVIGGVIGLVLSTAVYGFQAYFGEKPPLHVMAIGLIMIELLLTGGLHCDGLMDTIDGVFSGRSRERMLEIMKDSRVGAFGAMAFGLLMLLKYSLFMDITPQLLPVACLAAPVIGRMGIVMAITRYPYARPEGLGKIFRKYAEPYTLYLAGIFTFLLISPLGIQAIISCITGIVFANIFACYVSKRLGGLTGDVYGAICELTEVVVLVVYIF